MQERGFGYQISPEVKRNTKISTVREKATMAFEKSAGDSLAGWNGGDEG
jgi:hypothetical protein